MAQCRFLHFKAQSPLVSGFGIANFLLSSEPVMPVTYVSKSAATSVGVPVPSQQSCAGNAKKQRAQGHCKPIPFDFADLHKPGRLRVGHLMHLFSVSHSTFYKYQAAGLIPKPDGKEFKRPFWLTSTLLPYFSGTAGVQQ
jgi:hypothetical protein